MIVQVDKKLRRLNKNSKAVVLVAGGLHSAWLHAG
jgi:hypothetical protein